MPGRRSAPQPPDIAPTPSANTERQSTLRDMEAFGRRTHEVLSRLPHPSSSRRLCVTSDSLRSPKAPGPARDGTRMIAMFRRRTGRGGRGWDFAAERSDVKSHSPRLAGGDRRPLPILRGHGGANRLRRNHGQTDRHEQTLTGSISPHQYHAGGAPVRVEFPTSGRGRCPNAPSDCRATGMAGFRSAPNCPTSPRCLRRTQRDRARTEAWRRSGCARTRYSADYPTPVLLGASA